MKRLIQIVNHLTEQLNIITFIT